LHTITYEINLNEYNRPYIELLNKTCNNAEDKFFVIELARYILQDSLSRVSYNNNNIKNKDIINDSINLLYDIGDQIALILFEQMMGLGDAILCYDNKYHFKVKTLDELNKTNKYILFEDKIFEKQEGLKALNEENNKIYLLGNDNNWEEIK